MIKALLSFFSFFLSYIHRTTCPLRKRSSSPTVMANNAPQIRKIHVPIEES